MSKEPILAICYDFDKTLSPENMQDTWIRELGCDTDKFWEDSNHLSEMHSMDKNLAYMYKMIQVAKGKRRLTRESLVSYGQKVPLYDGLEDWFVRINNFAKENQVKVEHYIISSGLAEIIEGTSIAKYFNYIYASSFYYDDSGKPCWPAQVINYTNKTQFLFRIEKGTLDINDNKVNTHFKEGKLRIPFRNIVYLGDSATDIPCMRLVNSLGGHSIGVYDPKSDGSLSIVHQMINDGRIRYYAPSDYRRDSDLECLLKQIIQKTSSYEVLENRYLKDKKNAQS